MNVEKHLTAEVSEIAFTILCCVICFVEQRKKIKTTTTDSESALAAAQATSIFVSHRGRNYFRCVSLRCPFSIATIGTHTTPANSPQQDFRFVAVAYSETALTGKLVFSH